MRWIQLFEAFNNTDRIEKVNFILLCWAIEAFFIEGIENGTWACRNVRHNSLKIFIIEKVNDSFHNYVRYFISGDNTGKIAYILQSEYEGDSLSAYINEKGINPPSNEGLISIDAAGNGCTLFYYHSLSDEMHFVVKKIYQDEKNKTI